MSFRDESNWLLLSLSNDYVEGLQNIKSCRMRLRLSSLENLPQFSLNHVWDDIKRKESNISFLISSRLNYSGTLNSLVVYSNY